MTTPNDSRLEVRKTVEVSLPAAAAFTLFTSRMREYWPAEHSIGASAFIDVVVEPHVGGRWFERGTDGAECVWGEVVAWEPPARLVLDWQVSATWQYDADLHTQLEITFTPVGETVTRVDLRHGGLENYGDRAEEMRALFDSPGAWAGTLARFAGAANAVA